MESIVKKLFLSGCLVVGLAITLTSVATYADETKQVKGDTSFKLTVQNALTLSNVTAANITAKPDAIATGNLISTVQSGSGFTLSLQAAVPDLRENGTSTTNKIPAADLTASSTSTGWGIKKYDAAASTYTALTSEPAVFYKTTSPANTATNIPLEIGVYAAKTLPAGNYSTTVTVTAATAS